MRRYGTACRKDIKSERDVLDLINVNLINSSDALHSSSGAVETVVAGMLELQLQNLFSVMAK